MTCNSSQVTASLTRRRLLQGALNGTTGILAWHQGWPQLRTELAQKGGPNGLMTWAIHVTSLLHKIQQKLYDEARFIPIWELGFLSASGPRVMVSGIGLIRLRLYSAPFEDVQLKS